MREQERSRERFCFRLKFTHPNSLRISTEDARKDTRPLRIREDQTWAGASCSAGLVGL